MTSSPSILLVEDDEDIQENLQLFLNSEGYSVSAAYNGREALDLLKDGLHPRLILLDLMMPIMSGYEFLQALRSEVYRESVAHPPIVLLSASTDIRIVAEKESLPYLRKPLNLEELLRVLEKHEA
jgi:CheY-like chemotaxis protein